MDENLENGVQLFDSLIYILGDKEIPMFEEADVEVEYAYRCLSNEVFQMMIDQKALEKGKSQMMANLLRMRTDAIGLVQKIHPGLAFKETGNAGFDNYEKYEIALLILNKLDDLVEILYNSNNLPEDFGI